QEQEEIFRTMANEALRFSPNGGRIVIPGGKLRQDLQLLLEEQVRIQNQPQPQAGNRRRRDTGLRLENQIQRLMDRLRTIEKIPRINYFSGPAELQMDQERLRAYQNDLLK